MTNTIASKLIKVMHDCNKVTKDATNDFHRYKYASASAVLEKVNNALVQHKLASLTNTQIVSHKETTTSKGSTEHLVTVQTTITIVDIETGETHQISALGSGQDSGDKAIAKAQTMALKYAWMMTLNISTGDDPEADATVDERVNKVNQSSIKRWEEKYKRIKTEDEYQEVKREISQTFKTLTKEQQEAVIIAANASKTRIEQNARQ